MMDEPTPDAQALVVASGQSSPLDLAISVWLYEKGKRSDSSKTAATYRETLEDYRAALRRVGLDLDSTEEGDDQKLAMVATLFADARDSHESRAPGTPVANATFNQRLAILSSFYTFARRRRFLHMDNPIEQIDRRPTQAYHSARPLDTREVTHRFAAMERETLAGCRDYALLAVALYTGRRLAELASLTWKRVELRSGQVTLIFDAKGGKTLYDKLSRPVSEALMRWLYRWYGAEIGRLSPDAPLWVALEANTHGRKLSARSIANICRKHMGTSKVHALRHTFAHGMEAVGAPVSEIQARLGHANLATTGRYLAALRSDENSHGDELTALFGLK